MAVWGKGTNPQGSGGAASSPPRRERILIASQGQTAFNLGQVPTVPASVTLLVNGGAYELTSPGPAFTLAGTAITWTGLFTLSPSDSLVASYT